VIHTVRPKLSCACCSRILQEPAPNRPIGRGLAGPGLLAHVLVSKYADHLPLYRQSEIYEGQGLELDRSTLADWVGGASRTLQPLVGPCSRRPARGQRSSLGCLVRLLAGSQGRASRVYRYFEFPAERLAPHDLRRTCARLCHSAGGELEQIQFLLGHVSIQTTERYLGCKQRIRGAVNDRIGIEPKS
jgi:hypothetical protein